MGYDDKHYPGSATPGDFSGPPRDGWRFGGGRGDDAEGRWLRRIRVFVSAAIALPFVIQIIVMVVNWASAAFGRPLDIPNLLTREAAADLWRAFLAAVAVGGY